MKAAAPTRVALAVVVLCFGAGFAIAPENDIDNGLAAMKRGDFDEAIRLLTRAVESDKLDDVQRGYALNDRGMVWMRKRDYDRAMADYDAAIRLDGRSWVAFGNRGQTWYAMRDYDHAIADYGEAIRLHPEGAELRQKRAFALTAKRDYDPAVADLDQVIAASNVDANALNGAFRLRGRLNFLKGNFTQAAKDLEQTEKTGADGYNAIWLFLSRTRAGVDGTADLEARAQTGKPGEWPAPIMSLLVGKTAPEGVLASASDPDEKIARGRRCEADFYIGEWHLLGKQRDKAVSLFRTAARECDPNFLERQAAAVEIERLSVERNTP